MYFRIGDRTSKGYNLPMRFLVSFLFLTLCCKGNITPSEIVKYKNTEHGELKLHVFLPEGEQKERPAIVYFFGGGWKSGTPKQFYQQAATLAEKGIVGFCAEYRIKNKHKTTPFECVEDGKSAIRWVREHAAKYGINPQKIASMGGSAGGHLTACAGVIEGYDVGNTEISSQPNLMILFNPVLDTTEKGYGAERFTEETQTALSPCHHVKRGIVPTIIFQGNADTTTPIENSQRFTDLMKEAGNSCKLITYEGKTHGFFNSKFFRPKITAESDYLDSLAKTIEFLTLHSYITIISQQQSSSPTEN